MKLVAPILTTILLSWILYRKTGTWAPVEVFSKAEYDAYTKDVTGQTYQQAHRGVAFEESIDIMEARKMGLRDAYGRVPDVGKTFENPITL
jgi:hypothetical protein